MGSGVENLFLSAVAWRVKRCVYEQVVAGVGQGVGGGGGWWWWWSWGWGVVQPDRVIFIDAGTVLAVLTL